jgi:prolyl-tRNA editing enzyme YbaK/EbsC (Cys-tRNA(Pro) deacylase)
MGLKEVQAFFKKYNKENEIVIVKDTSATVALAAQALGTSESEIAKTLAFMVKEQPIVIVVGGLAKIDNRKYKDYFKAKAKMMKEDELLEYTGHLIGGVCPFALKDEKTKVYLDKSLQEHEFYWPACGSPESAIKLSVSELEKYTNYIEWIDVTK